MERINQISLYGGVYKPKSIQEFTHLVQCEVKHELNLLSDEMAGRKLSIQNIAQRKILEYEFIGNIVQANSNEQTKQTDPALLMKIEAACAGLNYDNACSSFTLSFWQKQYGEHVMVRLLCDVMNYFLLQFQVKEKLADSQLMLMSGKLLVMHPQLRIMEIIFVFNNALNGQYGPTYQRIGIDTILGWLQQFFKDASAHLELKMTNLQPHESRGEAPWQAIEERTKRYQQEIQRKAETNTKIFAAEKRKREIEEELDRMNATKEQNIT